MLTLALGLSQQATWAETESSDQAKAEAISAIVEAVAPTVEDSATVPVYSTSEAITARGENLDIAIPVNDAGEVSLSRPGDGADASLSVGLPATGSTEEAVVAEDGTVTYNSNLPSTDIAVQAFDDGVRVQTVLLNAAAPTEFTYPVNVPVGGSMTVTEDGGVLVLDAEGVPHGGFAAPWAKDSQGADVPTRYEIRGRDVIQFVDHASAGYPVVADPWLWRDLISSANWVRRSEGWTLEVAPTGWARWNAGGYAVGVAGWNELYAKYRYRGLNTNLDGMRDQWICHQQIVAIRTPRKATWNLDEWRPNVSYAQTVNASCNPGGAKWFD